MSGAELENSQKVDIISDEIDRRVREFFRRYLIRRRQALIMELGEIEDSLEMPRSIIPKRKRDL